MPDPCPSPLEATVPVFGNKEKRVNGNRRILFFVSSWIVIALLSAYIIAPAPVFLPLRESLLVGNAAVGALISVTFLSAILAQIPGGYLIDRVNNRYVAALSIAGLSVSSLPAAFRLDYEVIFVTRLLAGVFLPLTFVSLINLIGTIFHRARSRVLGAFLAAPSAGHALGMYATPYVASALGLASIFAAFTLPTLVLLPLGHWSSAGVGEDRGPMYPLRRYVAAFGSREMWTLGAAFACTMAVYVLFTSWMPSFLSASGGLSPESSGIMVALIPTFGILSIPLGGWLADTRFQGDQRAIPLLSFLTLLPLTLVWLGSASVAWAFLLLPLLGFSTQLPIGIYYALSSQTFPKRLTGTAYAFMNVISMAGGVVTPILAGLLLDLTESYQAVFVLAGVLSLAGLLIIQFAWERKGVGPRTDVPTGHR